MRFQPDKELTDLLAKLGMEDFRAGRHFTRDERRWRTGEFWISKVWSARLVPSFDPWCRMLCARARHVEVERESPSWHRVVIAWASGQGLCADIDEDPVETAVRGVPLIPTDGSMCLDGISYSLSFETLDLSAQIWFSNPTNPHLRRIEMALISLASRLLTAEASPDGVQLAQTLERYAQRSGAPQP